MILMGNFRAEPEELLAAEARAAERVIRSGWFILGEELAAFERDFASWAGLSRIAGVGNGMDAIEIGLRACGIGPGRQGDHDVGDSLCHGPGGPARGRDAVLPDIDPDTGILDPASVARCLDARTRAVLLVHLFGRIADMDQWAEFCRWHGIALLEDCAQAHGARWKGRAAGIFGFFGAYSFYPTKNLGALGDGGAVASSTTEMDAAVRVLRNYGQSTRYCHEREGLNSRLDEMQAAIMRERLAWIDRFIARRRAIAAAYDEGIAISWSVHRRPRYRTETMSITCMWCAAPSATDSRYS